MNTSREHLSSSRGVTRPAVGRLERQRDAVPLVAALESGAVRTEGGLRISVRQCQVLELLAAGATNEQIAAQLGLSQQTVKHHVSRLLRTLCLPNRVALAAWWAEVDASLAFVGPDPANPPDSTGLRPATDEARAPTAGGVPVHEGLRYGPGA